MSGWSVTYTASEKCSCGAQITVEGYPQSELVARLSEWRREHRHEPPPAPPRPSQGDRGPSAPRWRLP